MVHQLTRRSLTFLTLCVLCAVGMLAVPESALAAGITLRSVSSNNVSGVTSFTLNAPAGVAANDVMVAQITVRGGTGETITAPSGWNLIRRDDQSTNLAQALYYKVATSSEPSSYTWTFGTSHSASGGILDYTGVSTSIPIDTSGGQVGSSGTAVTAPSVTTTVANDMLADFSGIQALTTFTAPSGMTKEYDSFNNSGSTDSSANDALQATAGSSGSFTATAGISSPWVGQLVALEPIPPCSSGGLTLSAPSSTSFSSVTLNGSNRTRTVTLVLTPDDERGTGAGWNITGTSTTFTTGSHNLSTSATAVTAASAAAATGNCALPTNSISYAVTLPAGSTPPTAVKLYNASANTGEGPTNVSLTFQLSVPANVYQGTYSSTWTFAIVSGP
jgi:hypothetical protein